jgi:hypothetical protein
MMPHCGIMPLLDFDLKTDRERVPADADLFPRSLYEQST